jgi:hypothetical protein
LITLRLAGKTEPFITPDERFFALTDVCFITWIIKIVSKTGFLRKLGGFGGMLDSC